MLHRIEGIYPMPDYVLGCKFSDGAILLYDLKPLFKTIPAFAQLIKQPGLYHKVAVSVGGYGIIWNDDLDLSSEEIWEHGWPEWDNEKLVTIEIEIEIEILQTLEKILRPYGLSPEDWCVMALEFCVFPATQNLAVEMLLNWQDRIKT